MAENKDAGRGGQAGQGESCVRHVGAPKVQELGGVGVCPSASCLFSSPGGSQRLPTCDGDSEEG